MAEIAKVNDLREDATTVLGGKVTSKVMMMIALNAQLKEVMKTLKEFEEVKIHCDAEEFFLTATKADGGEMELHWLTDEAGTITIF